MDSINFFYEDTSFILDTPALTSQWVFDIIQYHSFDIEAINFIFCSDDYLLEINRSYLDHDYYTDIITFDNRESVGDPMESDIFISIDRVEENANGLHLPADRELHRVLIHGILHLLGWNDKTAEQKQAMREKEEACLSLHPNYN
jgi:rRNA maturation RNase YbeY